MKANSALFHLVIMLGVAAVSCDAAENQADPEAVKRVLADSSETANAAWWGFNEQDATEVLQAAIRSRAKKLIVPNMRKPWIVKPLFLESNQEIIFEKGVVLQAATNAFRGVGDSLLTADAKENIILQGEAELIMRKGDYRKAPYEKGEWRMCLSLRSCRNVKVYGLRLAGSGGDGIYLGRSEKDGSRAACETIHIKNVVCDDNYRQGISIISARDLLIEDSTFQKTEGTAPQSGVDFEPNREDEYLSNCVLRNCAFKNNAGYGILFAVGNMGVNPISIRIENCTTDQNKAGSALVIDQNGSGKANGLIELLGNEKWINETRQEKLKNLKVAFGSPTIGK